ncbi:hypothetical protein M011DRAFT_507534 [Sporormia fimetaria CBS 119925]|uniref:Uncharacterized protein n=1 Tax=Sporormia fimetaria CBS 119925 TaxID=1340428 RepID=A0A6A6VMN1_9PLEO|nr:hypothetical protein M011DRAFT_507534 [Sporormia fimetaria CBS 119925]
MDGSYEEVAARGWSPWSYWAAQNSYVKKILDEEDRTIRDLCGKIVSVLPLELREEIYGYLAPGDVFDVDLWRTTGPETTSYGVQNELCYYFNIGRMGDTVAKEVAIWCSRNLIFRFRIIKGCIGSPAQWLAKADGHHIRRIELLFSLTLYRPWNNPAIPMISGVRKGSCIKIMVSQNGGRSKRDLIFPWINEQEKAISAMINGKHFVTLGVALDIGLWMDFVPILQLPITKESFHNNEARVRKPHDSWKSYAYPQLSMLLSSPNPGPKAF